MQCMARTVSHGASELLSFIPPARRKMKPVYKFCPYRVTNVKPLGFKSPKPRSGHRIVADSANVYSFGGYNPQTDIPAEERGDYVWMHSCLLFKELWKFNFASRRWTKLRTSGAMPEELASHAAVLLGKQLIIFGGTGVPFGGSSSNSVHLCNLDTLEWKLLETSGDPPLQQYGQAIAVDQGKLYVVGGTTGFEYSMNVHCLDLKTLEWTEMYTAVQPEPRYRHEIAIEDGKLFVFGGGTASQSFTLKEVPIFDIDNLIWQSASTSEEHPLPRRCHGCVKVASDVFISGGCDSSRIFSDIWCISLKSLTWRKLPCILPQPVYFHSAAVSPEGQMFIFGGVTNMEENTRTNELYSVWLKIPSLKEICWQSMLYYVPHIANLKKHELLALGIPLSYLDRIDCCSVS